MTDNERELFFNQVKGKKIRWSTWAKKEYFIPEQHKSGPTMEGKHFDGFSETFSWFCIVDGFGNAVNPLHFWEFFEKDESRSIEAIREQWYDMVKDSKNTFQTPIFTDSEPQETQKAQCSCALETIMQTGCTCGGI